MKKGDKKKTEKNKDNKVKQASKRGSLDKQQGGSSTEKPGTRYYLIDCCYSIIKLIFCNLFCYACNAFQRQEEESRSWAVIVQESSKSSFTKGQVRDL